MSPAVVRVAATALLFAVSVPAPAQQAAKVHRIGFLSPDRTSTFDAFRQGLRDLGYVEGRNVAVEARFADGTVEHFSELAAELVRLKVDVLVAGSPLGASTAKKATSTIPIVFAGVGDPLTSGIVANFARPGGNITGSAVGASGPTLGGKWLELLKEAVPDVSHVAALANRANRSNSPYLKGVEDAARALKLKLDIFDAGNPAELDRALAAVGASGAQAMVVTNDTFLFVAREKVVQFASGKRLPAMYFFKHFADAGGLMSYGASLEESYRRAATYVDKILKGAKPGELPVEQPTRYEFVINMKAARALGLKIPQSLRLRADHLIE